jgi:hypothetical protein
VLRLLLSAVTFDASPLFPDVRGAITKDLLGTLETGKWHFDSHDVFVTNEDSKRLVMLGTDTMMLLVGDPPADPKALREEFLKVSSNVLAHLEISHLRNFAMNLDWHVGPAKGSDFGAWMHEFFGLGAANELFDAFGGKPKTTEAKFSFEPQENVEVQVEIKPIDAEEAVEESFFAEDESGFPNEALELSLWRSYEPDEPFPQESLSDLWADSNERMMRMSERAGLVLTGRV